VTEQFCQKQGDNGSSVIWRSRIKFFVSLDTATSY